MHISILASIPALAALLAWPARRSEAAALWIRLALGGFLAANELVWYGYRLSTEGFRFPEALPLQLCDVALWLTVLSALALKPWAYELAYFWSVGGSYMAVLTPDLWEPFPSYPTVYFFLAHGFVVSTILFLAFARLARPRPGSVWRAFFILNGYTAAVGLFNFVFNTNYMYLCRKPESASLLDYLGTWPWYVVSSELVALAVFWLLWLPFRRTKPR